MKLFILIVYPNKQNTQVSTFVERFFAETAAGIDMDNSCKLMDEYDEQFKTLEEQRQDFGNRALYYQYN